MSQIVQVGLFIQSKQVWKILKIHSKSWEGKVDGIIESRDVKSLTMYALIETWKSTS